MATLNYSWSRTALQSGASVDLSNASPMSSLRFSQSSASALRESIHASASSLQTSKSNSSLSSQLELIQAALQEESEKAMLEVTKAAQKRRFEEADFDDADTEFGSEFDIGDRAQVRAPCLVHLLCEPKFWLPASSASI